MHMADGCNISLARQNSRPASKWRLVDRPLTLPPGCLQTGSVMQSAQGSPMDPVTPRAPSWLCHRAAPI